MNIMSRRWWVAAACLSGMLTAASVEAQSHSGGHAGGSAGHSSGAHAAAGHVGGGHLGGTRMAPMSRYSAYGSHPYAGSTFASGFHGSHYGGRPSYGYPGGGAYGHGYSTGAFWGGGWWHGGYWPRAYYGPGFAWFLPVLPLAYATYWYGGVPYYYANDVYYTWNPDYDGYVATDPPPVAYPDGSGSQSYESPPPGAPGQPPPGQQPPPSQQLPPGESPMRPPSSGGPSADSGAQIFMYPLNGQSEAQQSIDKRECQQWAATQAGAANAGDYRRAMLACVQGRGYSAN